MTFNDLDPVSPRVIHEMFYVSTNIFPKSISQKFVKKKSSFTPWTQNSCTMSWEIAIRKKKLRNQLWFLGKMAAGQVATRAKYLVSLSATTTVLWSSAFLDISAKGRDHKGLTT